MAADGTASHGGVPMQFRRISNDALMSALVQLPQGVELLLYHIVIFFVFCILFLACSGEIVSVSAGFAPALSWVKRMMPLYDVFLGELIRYLCHDDGVVLCVIMANVLLGLCEQ